MNRTETSLLYVFPFLLAAVVAAPPAAGFPAAPDPQIKKMVESITAADGEAILRKLVGFKTRSSSTQGCRQAVEWVRDQFVSWGLDSVRLDSYKSGWAPNCIGIKKGKVKSDSIFIICAHIDATSGSASTLAPGADDNGSGSAVAILAAKAMAKYDFKHDIRFILFTGEEEGLYGSSEYVKKYGADKIRGVINNDMVVINNSGASEDYELETGSKTGPQWLAKLTVAAAKEYTTLPVTITSPSG